MRIGHGFGWCPTAREWLAARPKIVCSARTKIHGVRVLRLARPKESTARCAERSRGRHTASHYIMQEVCLCVLKHRTTDSRVYERRLRYVAVMLGLTNLQTLQTAFSCALTTLCKGNTIP